MVFIQASYNKGIYLRGSLGFGEEALQSLPGKVGSQVLIVDYGSMIYFIIANLLCSFGI